MEVLQKTYTTINKEPQQKLASMLDDLRAIAPQFNIEDFDAGYKRVSEAADELGIGSVSVLSTKLPRNSLIQPPSRCT
jgi:hypothetical protein